MVGVRAILGACTSAGSVAMFLERVFFCWIFIFVSSLWYHGPNKTIVGVETDDKILQTPQFVPGVTIQWKQLRYVMYWTKMTSMCILFGIITGSILYVNGQATELRLGNVTGLELKPYEGPIEVFVDGEWGAITRNGVDNVTAKTVCKILGYGYTGFRVDQFRYTGQPKLSLLQCAGNETSLLECKQEAALLIGTAYDAPGVHCFDHVFTEVRLSGGQKANEGMVQVKMDGRWGRVCGYDQSNSAVPAPNVYLTICRTLGFQNYDLQTSFKGYDYDGVELSWLDLNYLSCTGAEEHFNQCNFQDSTIYQPRCNSNLVIGCITALSQYCSSDDICAGVENAFCSFYDICECKDGYLQTGPRQCSAAYTFRLFYTSELYNEGFVEVNISGQWSLITRELTTFNDLTSKVLCQTLGFGYEGFSSWTPYNSELAYNGSMACKVFRCWLGVTDATECFENNCNQIDLSDGTPVTRLHCYDSRINDIRLEGGLVPNEGRIEFRIGEKWGYVCIEFSFLYRDQVCKLLGYAERGNIYPTRTSNENLEVWLENLRCEANVTDINDCSYYLNHRFGCYAYYKWDLYCSPLRLVDGPRNNSGRIEAGFYGKLHTICADNFGIATANVSCKLLGYSDVLDVTAVPAPFGGEITMLNSTVECNGTERSLEHCNISISSDFTCQSGKAAGVTCLYYQIEDVMFKVYGGPAYVLQVLVQGVWRHVCGSEWDTADTNVACRTRGYTSGVGYNGIRIYESPVLPGHLQCTGNESHLNQCTYQKKGFYDHSESCSYFAVFECASECRQGFYDDYCYPCKCNATNTKSCDNVTGECFCAAGWVGSTCSTVDIDECATLTNLCPSNKICVNSPFPYSCECELGFMEIEDMCKECSPEKFGRHCSSTCICNTDNTIESPDGRKCDKVTGTCPCNEAWTGISCISDIDECLNSTICQGQNTQCKNAVGGYECICLQGYERQNEEECIQVASSNDTMMLVIILSSVVGGLALVIILFTICFCQYRRKIKGTADTTDKPVNGNSSRNVLTTSIRYRVTEEVYDYINDETDTVDANALQATNNKEDGYLDIDLVNRNDQVQSSENGTMPDKVNEYLDLNAVDETPQGYDYPYKGFELPERGHVDVGGVGRKLPEIPENSQLAGKEGTKDPYSQLKHQKLPEHMYERMADDHGYLKPVRPENLTSPGP